MESKIKAIVQDGYGGPEVLKLGETDFPSNDGKEDYIWIKCNRAETLQRKGGYPPIPGETTIIGLEASGYMITSPEEYYSGEYKQNKRIMALLPGGGYGDIARVHKDHVIEMPANMSFESAAAIPETWLTSYQLLFMVANATAGKTCLVHAAASGIGCAAIQLCKEKGVTTIAVSSSEDKLEFAKSLGASFGINYKESPDFSELVKEYTGGKGVDIILDCIGAQNFEYNIKSAAVDCQWVLYGTMGGVKLSDFGFEMDLRAVLMKRIQLLCSTLKTRSNTYKADLVSRFLNDFQDLFETGDLKPIIDTVYKFSEMPKAHERMEKNLNIGKIVCINDM